MEVTAHNRYYNTDVTVEVGEYPHDLMREVDNAWDKYNNEYPDDGELNDYQDDAGLEPLSITIFGKTFGLGQLVYQASDSIMGLSFRAPYLSNRNTFLKHTAFSSAKVFRKADDFPPLHIVKIIGINLGGLADGGIDTRERLEDVIEHATFFDVEVIQYTVEGTLADAERFWKQLNDTKKGMTTKVIPLF